MSDWERKQRETTKGIFAAALFLMVFVEILFLGVLLKSAPPAAQIEAKCRHHYGVRMVNQASLPYEDTVIVCNDGTAHWSE